jgi:hypothetical protein
MTHDSDIDTIEAGLERNRASLADTLNELQDRASVEKLASDALGVIRSNAAAYTSSFDNAVRSNPMAFALTGVGLLWMVFGGSKNSDQGSEKAPVREPLARWEDEGGSPAENTRISARTSKTDSDEEWWQKADQHRRHATGLLDWIEGEARKLGDSAADAYGEVQDFAAERAKVLADFTSDLQGALSHGLEDLSADARQRIVAVREKAYGARVETQRAFADVRKKPGRVVEDHPMVVGAITLALGAALAAALPRSRFEDRTLGSKSDKLMADARSALREERGRYADAATGLAQNLKDTVSDGLSDIAKSPEDHTQSKRSDNASKHSGAVKTDQSKASGEKDPKAPQKEADEEDFTPPPLSR